MATVDQAAEKKAKLVRIFLKLTGYTEDDVWGANPTSNVVVTSNGGKYQLGGNPTSVRKLAGPDYPKMSEAEVAEEE